MPDPIGRSSSNPYQAIDANTCAEPAATPAARPTPIAPEQCAEPVDPAVAQLTSKYRLDANAFLAAQEPITASAPPAAALTPNQRAIEYAELAHAAYDEKASPPGWHRLEAAELEAAGLDPNTFNTPETGFKAALFRNEATGEFALAFAGTEDGTDWRTNLNQGSGNVDSQYRQAAHLSVQVTDAVGQTAMIGHSLGGGLAATAAIASRNEGVTFNAAGVHANTLEFATTAREPAPKHLFVHPVAQLAVDRFEEWRTRETTSLHITNYRVAGDPLTTVQDLTPIPKAQGAQVDLAAAGDYDGFTVRGAVQLHLTGSVVDGLRAREYETQP
jgi:hypothetical protein